VSHGAAISRSLVLLTLCAGQPAFAQGAPKGEADPKLNDFLALLDTPVISASKVPEKLSEAAATMMILTRAEIARRGYTEISQVLNDLPGMQVVRAYGDSQVKNYWRGYRSFIGDPFLFLVDGLVQNSLYYNLVENTLTTVPLSNVDRIEVVYGPASSLYGANAFMGVIHVITRRGQDSSGSLGAGSNGHRFADVNFNTQGEGLQFSATLRVDNSVMDAGSAEDYEYTKAKYLADRRLWGIFVDNVSLAGQNHSQNLKRAIDLRLGYHDFEVAYQYYDLRSGYGNEYAADVVQNVPLWHRRESSFSLKYSQAFTEQLNGTTRVRYRESGIPGDSAFLDAGPYAAEGAWGAAFSWWQVQNSSTTFSQDFNLKVSPKLALSFGLTYEQRDLQKAYDNPYGPYQAATVSAPYPFPAQPTPGLQQQNRITQETRGAYGQVRWFLADHHSFILGGRSDYNSSYKAANTLRVGYVGNLGGLSLKALFGQAFQEPVPRSLYGGWKGSGSDPSLNPERSDTTEFSVGYTQSRLSISGSFWMASDKNVILGSAGSARNLGNRKLNGLDVHARAQMDLSGGLGVNAWSYLSLLTHNEGHNNADPVTQVMSGEGLTADGRVGDLAKVQLLLGVSLDLPRGHAMTLLGRYVGARDTVATNPVGTVDGHFVADLVYHRENLFAPGLGLTAKISNLTDTRYFDPGIAQGNAGTVPGRWSTAGTWSGSGGYYSSLLAQPGRSVQVSLNMRF